MHRDGSAAEPVPGDVSSLLRAWNDGDQQALAQLTPIVYGELRRLAHHHMKRERKTAKAWLYRELTGGTVNGSRTLDARR